MKIILALSTAIILFFGTSCKKDNDTTPYTCAACVQTPDALAANDNSSKGIYKGVVIGSTGTIRINIANNGTDISALLVIDGISATLNSTLAWVGGQPYVAPFTGTFNGAAATVTFSVDADGTDATIVSSNIPGHIGAVFAIVKESSSALVEGYNGTYSTTRPETGVFNILISRTAGLWGGISKENGQSSSEDVDGTFVNGKLFEGTTQIGTLNGDVITGSFQDSNNSTVTIEGRRVL